jgi:hypothetical protein
MYNVIIRCVHATIVAPRKEVSFTHSERVSLSLALVIQHTKRMRHVVIYGLPGTAIFYHTISQMAHFLEKSTEYKMCIFIFSTKLV